jgi:hypothetical protein
LRPLPVLLVRSRISVIAFGSPPLSSIRSG